MCVCVQVVHESVAVVEMKEPYIAGFLAFREVDFLLDRLKEVREKNPQHYPQVFPLCNETSNAESLVQCVCIYIIIGLEISPYLHKLLHHFYSTCFKL